MKFKIEHIEAFGFGFFVTWGQVACIHILWTAFRLEWPIYSVLSGLRQMTKEELEGPSIFPGGILPDGTKVSKSTAPIGEKEKSE